MSYEAIDGSHFVASHFLRDASTFPEITPHCFMAGETPFGAILVNGGVAEGR